MRDFRWDSADDIAAAVVTSVGAIVGAVTWLWRRWRGRTSRSRIAALERTVAAQREVIAELRHKLALEQIEDLP